MYLKAGKVKNCIIAFFQTIKDRTPQTNLKLRDFFFYKSPIALSTTYEIKTSFPLQGSKMQTLISRNKSNSSPLCMYVLACVCPRLFLCVYNYLSQLMFSFMQCDRSCACFQIVHAKVFQLLFPLPLGKQNVFVKCFRNMGNLVSASSSFDHPKTSKIYVNIVSFFFFPLFFFICTFQLEIRILGALEGSMKRITKRPFERDPDEMFRLVFLSIIRCIFQAILRNES